MSMDSRVNTREEEHSKLPWKWDAFSACDADGHMVLYYTTDDDGVHTHKEGDKALIVKAVNCHDDLVTALEAVTCDEAWNHINRQVRDLVLDALEKARG